MRVSRHSLGATLAVLGLPVALALPVCAGCGSSESTPKPPPARLQPRPDRIDEAVREGARDDYWTRTYDDLLSPDELRNYWALDERDRFEVSSVRLLELHMRQQLLARSGAHLSQPQLDAYASQPNLDACKAYLDEHVRSEHEK